MQRPLAKFFRDRGTHLAAMIAYFALLSFIPLTFLALSLLGLTGRADESSYLVTELKRIFPGSSITSIVHAVNTIQDNAAALGIIGGAALLWTSLSFFSVLESALNIVYGLPNRPFLRGKALAIVLTAASLVTLFVGLLAGSIGYDLLKRFAPGFVANGIVAYALSVMVSLAAVFLFLISIYYFLTNIKLEFREVLPGAVFAAIGLEASFQTLPIYLRLVNHVPALQAFGGPAILLVWLYVMANVIVFGAEINSCRRARREAALAETAAGLA
ncbi:MAG: YihY/virulence factor BrkB family protein [Actinomycetota bacterium]|nr:YihY/virulence factor BrkB family protein [Actinomycetota bacterium]